MVDSILKTRSIDPVGRTITRTFRHGKMLIFELDSGDRLISHLGMSGSWRISDSPLTEKHNHIQLIGRETIFSYVDPRRFGTMYFLKRTEADDYVKKVGVDISSPDFTAEYIYQVLKRYPDRKIKPFLLDQKFFAGVGNYIACEICAHAGIRPSRRAGKISKAEAAKIKAATDLVIEGQLKHQGNTFSGGYKDAFGNDGGGLSNLVVFYQKTCGLCQDTPVKKVILAQRGTYYCPKCQK